MSESFQDIVMSYKAGYKDYPKRFNKLPNKYLKEWGWQMIEIPTGINRDGSRVTISSQQVSAIVFPCTNFEFDVLLKEMESEYGFSSKEIESHPRSSWYYEVDWIQWVGRREPITVWLRCWEIRGKWVCFVIPGANFSYSIVREWLMGHFKEGVEFYDPDDFYNCLRELIHPPIPEGVSYIALDKLRPISELGNWHKGKEYSVYFAYKDNSGFWAPFGMYTCEGKPSLEEVFKSEGIAAKKAIPLGEDCYPAIEVSVCINVGGEKRYQTLYLPYEVVKDTKDVDIIAGAACEFFARLDILSVERVYYNGWSDSLWAVRLSGITPWC